MNKFSLHSLSKTDLVHQLSNSQERLERKEIELGRCMQELQGVKIKLDLAEDFKLNLQKKERELEKAQSKINKLAQQVKDLRAKVRSHNKEQYEKYSEVFDNTKERISKLEKLASTVERKVEALEKLPITFKLEKKPLVEQNEQESQITLSETHVKIQRLSAENEALLQQMEKLNSQNSMLRQANEVLKNKRTEQNGYSEKSKPVKKSRKVESHLFHRNNTLRSLAGKRLGTEIKTLSASRGSFASRN